MNNQVQQVGMNEFNGLNLNESNLPAIRELSLNEIEDVNGGAIGAGAVAVTAIVVVGVVSVATGVTYNNTDGFGYDGAQVSQSFNSGMSAIGSMFESMGDMF